ncbi:hypothetical protein HII31_07914 [Pseudocercospora fuligena]|uniref:Glycoside hydrolase family 76 protein n=1 Tax=Pseudocercospora fuligena TaxID=685502 RepID=A0A8H6RF88_9PEZI|nr:hypothetical protein HII31_07914 [Pseudocercospora fuligena]
MMAILLATGRRDGLFLAAVESLLVCSVFVSLLIMLKAWVAGTVLLGTSTAAAQNPYWTGWHGNGPAWEWSGPNTAGGFWFEQTEDAVATLQSTFFNGTYYPGTLQWINALIDTIVASTQETFTTGLETYNGNIPGAQTTATEIQNNIQKYYSQIEAYYGGEDTIQIFDAAYDDAQWVVLEWLEVIRFLEQYNAYTQSNLGQSKTADYAHRAHIFYNIVQDKFNTSQCDGGLTWNPTLATYKNAITNELFVSSSIAMYFFFPGDSNMDPYPHPDYRAQTNKTLPPLPYLAPHDPLLLQNAKETWSWMKSHNFTNSQGLIVDGFHISDGQTSCDERNEMVYTYNQGVMLSGLRYLWEATSETSYLTDGYNLIDTVIRATGWSAPGYAQAGEWAGLGRNGILEDYCDAPANCSNDNLIFKGAYFEHMDIFCNALPTLTPMVAGISKLASSDLAEQHYTKCNSYSPWVQHNAWAALSTRNSSGVFGEWWGAPFYNKTQAPWPQYAEEKPKGSWDIWNDPGLLNQSPWKCEGLQYGCGGGRGRRLKKRQDTGEDGQVRGVATQAQGLSVVKAAADWTLFKSRKP